MLFGYAVMIAYDDGGGSGVVLQCPWRFRGGQKKPPQQSLSNRAELVCEGMGGWVQCESDESKNRMDMGGRPAPW